MGNENTVAIVGGGCSGSLLAINLMRLRGDTPLRVLLIDRAHAFGRGLAYGTSFDGHLLNVPAGNMSAFPDDPAHFVRYLRERDPLCDGSSFVPRRAYGDYLTLLLERASGRHADGSGIERIATEVGALQPAAQGWQLNLADGSTRFAHHVALATGNLPPAPLRSVGAEFLGSPRHIGDPWAPGALQRVAPAHAVLMLGTGLTMVDVALQLLAQGHDAPLIAVSRRGLLPQAHRGLSSPPSYAHMPPEFVACAASPLRYLRIVRRHVALVESEGGDWRDVIASMRPFTPRLWQALDAAQQRRFLRHLRPWWDTHRHRMAPGVAAQLQAAIASGRLRILAGRLHRCHDDGHAAHAVIGLRNGTEQPLAVGTVINCTGPDSDLHTVRHPLLAGLLEAGHICTDPLHLGLRIAPTLAAVGRDGRTHERLWVTGPLLKGEMWEAVAVPELRVHAARAAREILRGMKAQS